MIFGRYKAVDRFIVKLPIIPRCFDFAYFDGCIERIFFVYVNHAQFFGFIRFYEPFAALGLSIGSIYTYRFVFTAIYIFIPNTKVKFKYAFISGLICGTVFQIFQFIYISGQIWVSKYNAIYGSFAFLPLLLIWMQFSWLICLFGAVLTYSSQNVVNFNFEKETNDISRRYSDYIILVIATVIVHRFKEGLPPMTKGQISRRYAIPIQLVERTVDELERVNIISQTLSEEERVPAYQPAVDISRLTLGYLLRAIDREGDEDFICNLKADFPKEWTAIIDTRRLMEEKGDSIALKDLKIEESRVLSHKLNNNE